MATTTTNYDLEKPTLLEKFHLSVYNNNADKIDTAIKTVSTAVENEAIARVAHEDDKVNPHDVTAAQVNVYTKTEVQTSGDAEIHWDNITNAPAITAVAVASVIGAGTALPATTGTMTATMDGTIKTITPTGDCTFNATGGVIGQTCTFVILTSGSTTRTLTFGTNFKVMDTLTTGSVSGKYKTISFVYNGSLWLETTRSSAM